MLIRVYDRNYAAVGMSCLIGMLVLFLLSLAGFESGAHVRRYETLDQVSLSCDALPQPHDAIPPGSEAASVSGHAPPGTAAGRLVTHQGAAAASSLSTATLPALSATSITY